MVFLCIFWQSSYAWLFIGPQNVLSAWKHCSRPPKQPLTAEEPTLYGESSNIPYIFWNFCCCLCGPCPLARRERKSHWESPRLLWTFLAQCWKGSDIICVLWFLSPCILNSKRAFLDLVMVNCPYVLKWFSLCCGLHIPFPLYLVFHCVDTQALCGLRGSRQYETDWCGLLCKVIGCLSIISWGSQASKNTATVVAISKIQAESNRGFSSPQKPWMS